MTFLRIRPGFTANRLVLTPTGPRSMTLRGMADAVASGSGVLLMSESFEDGDIGSRGWFDDPTVPVVADARPGSTGTNSLDLSFALSATKPTGVDSARVSFTPSDSVYLSYWIKHSTNWVGSGQTYHPHIFSFLTDVDDPYIGPSITHLTLYDEIWYETGAGGMVYRMALQDALNIDSSSIGVDLTATTEDRAVCGANGQPETGFVWDYFDYGGPLWTNYKTIDTSQVFTDANKNDWHHIETFWQMNTISGSIGQPDGIMQMRIDGGAYLINKNDVYFRTNKNPTMKFETFIIAPYIQDGAPAAQWMRVDDMVIATALL